MLTIAGGIIIAIIFLIFASEIIAFAFLAGGFLIVVGIIVAAFLIDPVFGAVVLIVVLLFALASSADSPTSNYQYQKHTKEDKESEDPLSVLPFHQRFPIKIGTIALLLQPAFTERGKIKKLLQVGEHKSKITAHIKERKLYLKERAENEKKIQIEQKINKQRSILSKKIHKLEKALKDYGFLSFSYSDEQIKIELKNNDEKELMYVITPKEAHKKSLMLEKFRHENNDRLGVIACVLICMLV